MTRRVNSGTKESTNVQQFWFVVRVFRTLFTPYAGLVLIDWPSPFVPVATTLPAEPSYLVDIFFLHLDFRGHQYKKQVLGLHGGVGRCGFLQLTHDTNITTPVGLEKTASTDRIYSPIE